LGRPLGKPGDAAFQIRVLQEAFALLDATEGPVLRDFPETIEDSAAQPLSCQVPPRVNSGQHAVLDEAAGVKPAYERALAESGRTNVGRVVSDASGIPGLLEGMVRIKDGTPWKEAGLPNNDVLEASKDIMSYYEEAAAALAGHIPAARAAETWFFAETEAGQLLKDVRQQLQDDGVPFGFYVAPMTQ